MPPASPGLGGMIDNPPPPLRIQVPAHVATNVEGLVTTRGRRDVAGGAGHLWKLVRTFDDPATWTEPHVRHLAATGPGRPTYRTEPLPDQWELYDLDADPIEADNRWDDPDAVAVFDYLRSTLAAERARARARAQRAVAVRRRPPAGPPIQRRSHHRPPAACARCCSGSGCIPTTTDCRPAST